MGLRGGKRGGAGDAVSSQQCSLHSVADPFPAVLEGAQGAWWSAHPTASCWASSFPGSMEEEEGTTAWRGAMLGALCLPKYTQGLAWG